MSDREKEQLFKNMSKRLPLYGVIADHAQSWHEDEKDYAKASCSLSEGEKPHSFIVVKNKNIFYCARCVKGGDIFSYISFIKKCSIDEAIDYLKEKYASCLSDTPS
jgi:DNA primase